MGSVEVRETRGPGAAGQFQEHIFCSSASTLEQPQYTGFLWFGFDVLCKEHRELGEGWLNVHAMLPVPPSVLSLLCASGLVSFTFLPDSSWQKGHGLDPLASALTGDFIRCGWPWVAERPAEPQRPW